MDKNNSDYNSEIKNSIKTLKLIKFFLIFLESIQSHFRKYNFSLRKFSNQINH